MTRLNGSLKFIFWLCNDWDQFSTLACHWAFQQVILWSKLSSIFKRKAKYEDLYQDKVQREDNTKESKLFFFYSL